MGDEYTRVRFGMMDGAHGELLASVAMIDEITDEFFTAMKNTLGDDAWDGGARAYFEERRAVWNAAEAEMARQLTEAANALSNANVNYQNVEAANRAIWSNPTG